MCKRCYEYSQQIEETIEELGKTDSGQKIIWCNYCGTIVIGDYTNIPEFVSDSL